MTVKGKGPQRFPYGVSFDDLPEGAIIAVGNDPTKDPIDSGGRYLDDGTTLMPKLAVGSESVDVGAEVILTDNAASVGFRRNSDGMSRSIASTRITDDGYERQVRQEFKEKTTIPLNPVESTVNNSQVIQFDYDAAFEFVAKSIHIRVTGEVLNFQISVQKDVDGQFKTVRNLIPPRLYEEGVGGYIVNADPPPEDKNPRAVYFVRDTMTNDVTIPIQDATLVEVGDDDERITFRLIFSTTDPSGMQMSGDVQDRGFGSQFYPYLLSTGHDTTRIPIADRRDVARRFSAIDDDTTYVSKNDFYRNRHQLSRFIGDYTLTYDTPDLWEEGDSLELYGDGGDGVLAITGYTINGQPTLPVPNGHRYVVTLEDIDVKDFIATPIGAVGAVKPVASFNVESNITSGSLVPVDGVSMSVSAGGIIRDTVNGVVIVPYDGLYRIDVNCVKDSTGNDVATGIDVRINGTNIFKATDFTRENVTTKDISASIIYPMAALDEISWIVTGTDLEATALAPAIFGVEYVGPNTP